MKAKNNEITVRGGRGGGGCKGFFYVILGTVSIFQCKYGNAYMTHNGTLKSFVGSSMNYISMSKITKKNCIVSL